MDSPSTEYTVPDPVRQFSIFTENKVGQLSSLVKFFGRSEIHVMALTTLDTTDSAIVRTVVDDPDKARMMLEEHGYAFSESPIMAVEIAGEYDVERVLTTLLEVEVNVHYMYSFISRPNGQCALAMSIEDMDIATHILNTRNVKMLSQRDISR
ncbi:acetolactate synthase [Puniceicoccaceae bacterium K14]|nr:acetolactate synthase [Puniceicoccaceae bacterium K14]